jgi:hypothetical protein
MSLEYGLIAAFLLLVVVPFFMIKSQKAPGCSSPAASGPARGRLQAVLLVPADRLARPQQGDQRAPGRHAGDEGFRSPRLSRVKSIFPCRPCMAFAWADISAVMSPRQYLGMAVRSEETSTIQPDVVRHQRGAQSRPFSEPRDRTASGAGTSGRPSGTLPVQPARNMLESVGWPIV